MTRNIYRSSNKNKERVVYVGRTAGIRNSRIIRIIRSIRSEIGGLSRALGKEKGVQASPARSFIIEYVDLEDQGHKYDFWH